MTRPTRTEVAVVAAGIPVGAAVGFGLVWAVCRWRWWREAR